MEAFHQTTLPNPWALTQLYTEAKRVHRAASLKHSRDDSPEIQSLHRKFRIQKDRLIAWGLEWTDDGAHAEATIDASIQRAGLTEVVSSVMENIKCILDEVEQMRNQSVIAPPPYLTEKHESFVGGWNASNKARYEDLVRDLTSAIDLLCDLSRSRRPATPDQSSGSAPVKVDPLALEQSLGNEALGFDAFEVHNGFVSQTEPLYTCSVPQIDPSSITLPPPPYDGPNSATQEGRILGLLHDKPSLAPSQYEQDLPVSVLIDYVRFDRVYHNTNIPLPLGPLEHFFKLSKVAELNNASAVPRLIGYFEDPHEPRFGLVFRSPGSVYRPSEGLRSTDPVTEPVSLYDVLQKAAEKPGRFGAAAASSFQPPLETRFRLAEKLLEGFAVFQRNAFLHRDVCSKSVLLPKRGLENRGMIHTDLKNPLIVSYHLFAENFVEEQPRYLTQNIYLHPNDPRHKGSQSLHPQFEVYSLGLILLEIGLWHPLDGLYKEKFTLEDFKTRLDKLWLRKLSGKCGTVYMRAVQRCLSAGEERFSAIEELKQLFSAVIKGIKRCCLLDTEEEELPPIPNIETAVAEPPAELIRRSSEVLSKSSKDIPASLKKSATAPSGTLKDDGPPKPATDRPVHHKLYFFHQKQQTKEIEDLYDKYLEERLWRVVLKVLGPSRESVEIWLDSMGMSEATAKPTLCIRCSNTKKVRAAVLKYVKFDKEAFNLAVLKGQIKRSKSRTVQRSAADKDTSAEVLNPRHQERPICGASIGAWHNSEHQPPASFGGIILLDGEPYGLTVHHLLGNADPEGGDDDDDADDNQGVQRMGGLWNPSKQLWRHGINSECLKIDLEEPDNFIETLDNVPALVYDEDDEYDSDADFSDSELAMELEDLDLEAADERSGYESDAETEGDEEALGEDKQIIITQPALQDVSEDFFPEPEDRDDDHLCSHSLGHIYATSGIRRRTLDGQKHEVDWALLKLRDERLQPFNLVPGGRRHCDSKLQQVRPQLREPICRQQFQPGDDLYPYNVAKCKDLGGLKVHSFGRTSGLQCGTMSRKMVRVRFRGRRTPSVGWYVTGNFGHPGDSGAWVIDNWLGRVVGYVLGRVDDHTYIAPLDVMLDDIKHSLGVRDVALPNFRHEASLALASSSATASGSSTPPRLRTVRPGPGLDGSERERLDDDADDEPQAPPLPARPAATYASEARRALLYAHHSLSTGNPTHLEREWSARRARLGHTVTH